MVVVLCNCCASQHEVPLNSRKWKGVFHCLHYVYCRRGQGRSFCLLVFCEDLTVTGLEVLKTALQVLLGTLVMVVASLKGFQGVCLVVREREKQQRRQKTRIAVFTQQWNFVILKKIYI